MDPFLTPPGILKAPLGAQITKVAVKLELGGSGKGDPQLVELDQKRPLAAVIQDLCKVWQLAAAENYALQWDAQDHPRYLHYVTEWNRIDVKQGTVLRLTSSATKMATDLLHRLKTTADPREVLQRLSRISSDNTFATEFILGGGLKQLTAMVEAGPLQPEALVALLASFVELMDHGHVSWDVLEEPFVQQIATNVTSMCRTPTSTGGNSGSKTLSFHSKSTHQTSILVNSLLILEGVVGNGTDRMKIVEKCVPLDDVLKHIESSPREDVQTASLALLNAFFIKSQKPSNSVAPPSPLIGGKPLSLVNQNSFRGELFDPLLLTSIRNVVYEKILKHSKGTHLKPDMLHQLHVLEACMLNTLQGRLEAKMEKDDDCERAKIVELRQTAFEHLEADGTGTVAIRSSKDWAKKLGFSNVAFPWEDFERTPPGLLALDNLIYFARNHTDDYRRLVLENSRFDDHDCPVIRGCIALTKNICEVLKIGQPPMEAEQAQLFHPFFFSHEHAFQELFCLATRRLNKTWKEMRASVNDFTKVMPVVREQILSALNRQPETLEACKKELDQLARTIEIGRDVQEFASKPVMDLRKSMEVELMSLVRLQMLNSLVEGQWFNKNSKRHARDKYRFCRLSNDHKYFQYDDFAEKVDDQSPSPDKLSNKVPIVDIKMFFTGKNCPFLKGKRTLATYAFSLQLESEPSELDFIAPEEKVFDVWTDGINALLGQPLASKTAADNLDMLLDMEIRIQMLDLEGIIIPDTAPPIPEDPPDYDFLQTMGME